MTDLATGRGWRCGPAAAGVLVGFFLPGTMDERCDQIAALTRMDLPVIRRVAGSLRDLGMLVRADDPRVQELLALQARWLEMGWGAAFDYHLRTYDQLAEACDPRQLQLACGGTDWRSAPPPPTSAALAMLSKPFDEAWNASPDRSTTGVAKVVALLAAGGSAGPAIERYLVADALEGCDPGVWRYDPGSARLDWVAGLPSAATLGAMLHGPSRRPYRPAAFLLLTAVWERYMRRRPLGWAYRTVFMEAGHVAATLEVAARALGVPVFWQHGVDDHAWHDLIGVDPAGMQEGVLYAAAIGRAKTGA